MRPFLSRVRGRYIVPRPVTLAQLGDRLECTVAEARILLQASRFPHAYLDGAGEWRVPVPDIAAYIRWRNGVAGAHALQGALGAEGGSSGPASSVVIHPGAA